MTGPSEQITDDVLTAYLDGALAPSVASKIEAAVEQDDVLAARLAALDIPLDTLRAVMAPEVLGAPALPAAVLHRPVPFSAPNAAEPAKPRMQRFWVPVAVAASFVAGLVIAPMFSSAPAGSGPIKWVDAVASYQALYVTQTLSQPTQDPAATAQILIQAGADFNVTLAGTTDIDGLEFKRAQMLGWNDKPLLQIAYLDGDGTPMALCLTPVDSDDRGPQTSTNHNLAGVSWVKDGVGYYLIGGNDLGRVEALSAQVITRL